MSSRPPRDDAETRRLAKAKLTVHRGLATWGERLVPLGFRLVFCTRAPETFSAARAARRMPWVGWRGPTNIRRSLSRQCSL